MTHLSTAAMLDAHPDAGSGTDRDTLVACIDACLACVQSCTACAEACLAEESVADLRDCIRTDLDCADVCAATARVLIRSAGRNSDILRAAVQACADACGACGQHCRGHAEMHEHCRICAEACERCGTACRELLASLSG